MTRHGAAKWIREGQRREAIRLAEIERRHDAKRRSDQAVPTPKEKHA
jgi:hypothetical protein